MKNLILLIIVSAIAYSCATSKTQDEEIADKTRIAQERITLLKQAETSSNPAVLQQAELVKKQIYEETVRQERQEWFERNQVIPWLILLFVTVLMLVSRLFLELVFYLKSK
nr:hypothetical protein [uncultured Kingella sp.]